MFSGILSKISKNMPDNKLYRIVQIFSDILWDCQAPFLGLPGIFFEGVRGVCFRIFKGEKPLYSSMYICAIKVNIVILRTISVNHNF